MSTATRRGCRLGILALCALLHTTATPAQAFTDVAELSRQLIEKAKQAAPPFDAARWNELRVGMSAQDVLSRFGTPFEFQVINGGESGTRWRWKYYFDRGATTRELQFGSWFPASGKPVGSLAGGAMEGIGEATEGPLFYWTGRRAESATDFPLPGSLLRMVVPSFPGSGDWQLLAALGARLAARWPVDYATVTRTGIGQDPTSESGSAPIYTAAMPDDGMTLMAINWREAIQVRQKRGRLPYDLVRDFKPVAVLGRRTPVMVVVPASSPVTSLKDLATTASAQSLRAGVSGLGSAAHLILETFNQAARCNIRPTVYPWRVSDSDIARDVAAGKLDVAFVYPFDDVLLRLRSGELRALAMTGPAPSVVALQIPLAAESGFPSLQAQHWLALVVRAGTPDGIAARLADAIVAAMADDDVIAAANATHFQIDAAGVREASAFVRGEIDKWAVVQEQAAAVPSTDPAARLCFRGVMSPHEFVVTDNKDDPFDATQHNLFKPVGGMSRRGFIRAAMKDDVRLEVVSENEIMVGSTTFFFADGKLTEIQECP